MAAMEDLIDFGVIEGQKENILSLPGGRSAKKLAELFAPSPLHKLLTPTPQASKTIHDGARAGFEAELDFVAESDDPLDIYDRYARWTLDTYPSGQATPQSQLHTLLERATKAFLTAPQYKNDPRYLKLWLLYVRFFTDAPRETFIFLARQGIGDGLALFYEEYAGWLESAGRWAQAAEVFQTGLARDARPAARLLRKCAEFEQRRARLQPAADLDPVGPPPSPALPTVRPALAAKVNPFAPPQAGAGAGAGARSAAAGRPAKSKLAVFSDADADATAGQQPGALGSHGPDPKGWNSLPSLAERKKENTMEATPWAGETLAVGAGRRTAGPKMAVFRDPSFLPLVSNIVIVPSESQVVVHPQTGKKERILVNLQAIYPTPDVPGSELSFEEIWAAHRGWTNCRWDEAVDWSKAEPDIGTAASAAIEADIPAESEAEHRLVHPDVGRLDENGGWREQADAQAQAREKKGRKTKMVEVNETQIIKAKLDSPSRPKVNKKRPTTEPTMTIHTKAATDEIYEIFGQPLQARAEPQADGGDDGEDDGDVDEYETDGDADDATSGIESTGTTRQLSVSEGEDEDEDEVVEEGDEDEQENENENEDCSDATNGAGEWSDFAARKHSPGLGLVGVNESETVGGLTASDRLDVDDRRAGLDVTGTQIVATLADGDDEETEEAEEAEEDEQREWLATEQGEYLPKPRTAFVPMLPEHCNPPSRPYRDAAEAANNRLPFMTPITERTESSVRVESDRRHSVQTPSRRDDSAAVLAVVPPSRCLLEPVLSSPLRELPRDEDKKSQVPSRRKPLVLLPKKTIATTTGASMGSVGSVDAAAGGRSVARRDPVIKDLQCNPVDEGVRAEILANLQPPLGAYPGFYDQRDHNCDKPAEIRRFIKNHGRAASSAGPSASDRPVVLELPDAQAQYTIRRELGTGAFAPVYLAERARLAGEGEGEGDNGGGGGGGSEQADGRTRRRGRLEAIKIETPASAWEFHMMRLAHRRLGPQDRATASLSAAHELHLFRDCGLLVLQYHPHGTLLDVINTFRPEPSGAMDEGLAMFFTVELLRTVEALHGHGLMHGDVKADNCMLRLDRDGGELVGSYRADGSGGWAGRGVTLIDLGRGVDMRSFRPGVQFIADWKPAAQDCPEMRSGRPWTWHMDYHGLAGVVHTLLFGRYMDVASAAPAPGQPPRYRLREGLKRYWQADLWADCFDALLNPAAAAVAAEDAATMPLLRTLRRIRRRMEAFLEQHGERGVGLRALLGRVEAQARGRRRV